MINKNQISFSNIKDKINYLINKINIINTKYYLNGSSKLTDAEYDKLIKKLQKFYKKYPDLFPVNNPLNNITVDLTKSSFELKPHNYKMYSIANVFNENEFIKWIKSKEKKLNTNKLIYVCDLKLDGCAVDLEYKDGILVTALSRGDGLVGEDITNNIKIISNVPIKLSKKITCNIYGEIIISKKSFKQINIDRKKANKKLYSSPRNFVSSVIHSYDIQNIKDSNLIFHAYNIFSSDNKLSTVNYQQKMINISNLGIMTIPKSLITINIGEIIGFHKEIEFNRKKMNIPIDGIVIKINDFKYQEKLGHTNKYPNFFIAWKFQAKYKITKLIDVIFSYGRTNTLTPVGIVDPIEIDGVIVRKVSLSNYSNILDKNLYINDFVKIERSGDVIPKLVEVIKDEYNENNLKDIKVPKKCIYCGAEIYIQDNNGIKVIKSKCLPNCYNILVPQLKYAVSRKCLNIKGIGENLIKFIIINKLIDHYLDIFDIDNYKHLVINYIGQKRFGKIIKNITQVKKHITLDKFIKSIGISLVSTRLSKAIAYYCKQNNINFNNIKKSFDIDKVEINLNKSNKDYQNFIKFLHSDDYKLICKKINKYNINV